MSADDFSAKGSAHLQLCLERDRLLCSPEFARSPVMSKLLTFLVNYKLEGNTQPLKAYTIAVEALGRNEDFDPLTDSYPRVIIGRLRKIIDNHYLRHPGATRLYIPLNQYEIMLEGAVNTTASSLARTNDGPAIEDRQRTPIASSAPVVIEGHLTGAPMPDDMQGKRRPIIAFIAVLAVILALVSALFYNVPARRSSPVGAPSSDIDYPSIRVDDITTNNGLLSVGEQASVFFNQSFMPFGGVHTVINQPDDRVKSDYRFVINAVDIASGRLNLRLIREADNSLLWSKIIPIPKEIETIRSDLEKVVPQLVGTSGILPLDQSNMHKDSFAAGYHCLLQADNYLRFRDKVMLEPVMQCMRKTADTYPDDPYVLEKMSFVMWIAQRHDADIGFDESGKSLAKRALRVNPNNAYAAFAEARSSFFEGDCLRGDEWAKNATQANPLDARLIGYHAIYLAGCADPRAEQLAERAIELDENVDLGVYALLALLRYQQGDAQDAYRLSNRKLADSSRSDPGLMIMRTLSALAIGKPDEAHKTWQSLNMRFGLTDDSRPAIVLEKYIVNPKLRNAVLAEFERYDFP